MITAPVSAQPIEPVHWGAKLRRSPDTIYTEVAGEAVLCRTMARSLHVANEVVVGLLLLLDGKTLAEATEPVSAEWSDADRRRVIEVLRRLKAVGLIEDASADADPADLPDLDEVAAAPTQLVVRATVHQVDSSTVLELHSGSDDGDAVELTLEPGAAISLGANGDVIDRIIVMPEPDVAVLNDPLRPLDALSVWVDSLVEPDLAEPGVLDGLAGLAESHDVHPSPT